MQQSESSGGVLTVANLREYFHDALQGALAHQHVAVEDQTEQYVVNLLTLFSRSEQLYEQSASGVRIKPLVQMLSEALEAPTLQQRERGLQRLGDVSLFIAGFFAHSFARKLIDIDYHIAMGGNAYSSLADTMQRSSSGRSIAAIYAQLAQKFQRLVDALNEVSDMSYQHSDADILRLYEIWLKTGSARAHGQLQRLGVTPTPVALAAN